MVRGISRLAVWAGLLALVSVTASRGDGRPRDWRRTTSLPNRMLWAWERNEDLRFLPRGVGVAYLAKTITIGYSGAEVHPRMQPLRIPDGATLIAVVRIEYRGGPATDEVRNQIKRAVVDAGSRADVIGVQVDFDARVSERKFYRELLKDVRLELPKEKVLSMTALVSWCTNDDWIEGLPVDEVVPMYFRMGAHTADAKWWSEQEVTEPLCLGAMGRATDEKVTVRTAGREYWFSTTPWSEAAYESMEIGQ